MGKKSKGTPPPAPDYTALAKQQGQASIDASNAQANIARVNQTNPYGSLTWSRGPDGSWSNNTTLSPQLQSMLATLQGKQQGLLNSINPQGPDYSNLPAYQSNVAPQQLQTSLDMSGLPTLNQDYGAQSKEAQDANYKLQTQTLDPQYQAQEDSMRVNLINSGIQPGSEAYDRAVNDFYRQKQNDYNTARLSSIGAGNAQAASLNQQANQAYGTLFGARSTAGNFANQSALDQYSQQLQSANLANAVRQAGTSEANTAYQLPFQAYGALQSSQPSMPQFTNYDAQGVNAAPVYQAGTDQAKAAQDAFNFQQAQQAASNKWGAVLGAAGNFFTGQWGKAGEQVGSLFGSAGTQYGHP